MSDFWRQCPVFNMDFSEQNCSKFSVDATEIARFSKTYFFGFLGFWKIGFFEKKRTFFLKSLKFAVECISINDKY